MVLVVVVVVVAVVLVAVAPAVEGFELVESERRLESLAGTAVEGHGNLISKLVGSLISL